MRKGESYVLYSAVSSEGAKVETVRFRSRCSSLQARRGILLLCSAARALAGVELVETGCELSVRLPQRTRSRIPGNSTSMRSISHGVHSRTLFNPLRHMKHPSWNSVPAALAFFSLVKSVPLFSSACSPSRVSC